MQKSYDHSIRSILIKMGLYRLDKRIKKFLKLKKQKMNFPTWDSNVQKKLDHTIDIVRYSSIALAITRIRNEEILGDFAEVGVYQGELSEFISAIAPDRKLHLFDTFEGFTLQDAESTEEAISDIRFKDTSINAVSHRLGTEANVAFHQGWFPDTATGMEDMKFAFVMLDVDKYKPTLAGLEFFYSRVSRGGYIFLHDFNSTESDKGVSRALNEFLKDKIELLIELPDSCGSVVFRKV
jgi:O-methyltransferase